MLLGGFGLLLLAPHAGVARFPLVLISFCISFAAIVSFMFGRRGVLYFLPSLFAVVVFGVMALLFPGLDWPLRAAAGRYAAELLNALNFPVQLAVTTQGAPEFLLIAPKQAFVVATECNGFGLLVSSIMLVTILIFQFRLPLVNACGLLILAAPIAIFSNMFRIVTIVMLVPRLPISYNLLHETLGLIFYYAALGAIWILAENRREPDDAPETGQPSQQQPTPMESLS